MLETQEETQGTFPLAGSRIAGRFDIFTLAPGSSISSARSYFHQRVLRTPSPASLFLSNEHRAVIDPSLE
ncbi:MULTISPECIES: hypothetical protein [Paraburkholderia]|uniref:Uncharacterized protein n=1 Tax=Paraburkholderia dioscoreae TaxID=2604047 RepID=A0A5Q4ZCY5_9BURK|nr:MULTISPECIES: hypothetical protein [Paraburkholderia]MDR8401397.1 hypothetical protein [Paraburkholderia sp. USG1]VVD33109.1 protein of unknown function [Paraburkholderia dioscoreae]